MAKKQIQYTDNHQAELAKILRAVAYRHAPWQVFRDFVAMAAIALSNATDHRCAVEREAEYMKIVARYTKDETNELARGLSYVVMGLEVGMCDFLGSLYMSMELGDNWKGQYFTPYELCRLMAAMTLGEKAPLEIERKGFITVSDPCIGGGAMVIAAAHTMMDAGINYQQHMHAVAVDVDIVSVHMAYVQLSLLHIPAVIHHGNSISMQMWSEWRTPAHTLGFWDSKLRRAGDSACLVVPGPTRNELAELGIGQLVHELQEGNQVQGEEAPQLDEAPTIPFSSAAVNLRAQIPLF